MALPALFTATIASLAGQAAKGVFSKVIGAFTNPVERRISYLANSTFPNVIPDPDQLIQTRALGLMGAAEFSAFMGAHGINVDPGAPLLGGHSIGKVWQGYIATGYYRPSTVEIISGIVRGVIDWQTYNEIAKRYPIDTEVVPKVIQIYAHWPTFDELRELFYRGAINEDLLRRYGKATSGWTDNVIDNMVATSNVIPPITDLIRFSVREAFNEEMAQKLGLDQEYEESGPWKVWANAQGLGVSTNLREPGRGQQVDWPRMYWRSHWGLMAVGQGYEAFHRLRPNRLFLYRDTVPNIKPFTLENLKDLLKVNDILPSQRDILTALSFAIPRLVDLRRMWFTNQISDDELVEYMRDRGYTLTDAKRTREAWRVEKEDWRALHRAKKLDKYATAKYRESLEAFRSGILTSQQLLNNLVALLGNQEAARDAVEAEELRRRKEVVSSVIKTVREQFFTGEIPLTVVEQRLAELDLDPAFIRSTLATWVARFTLPRKASYVSTITRWVEMGLLTPDAGSQRLSVLGLSPRDVLLHIAEALARRQDNQARQTAKGGILNDWRTPERIAKWYREGRLSREEAEELLRRKGVPEEDLGRWLDEPPGTGEDK